jgi:hypothetical protein
MIWVIDAGSRSSMSAGEASKILAAAIAAWLLSMEIKEGDFDGLYPISQELS